MSKVLVIVQARLSSSRLPGKVLLTINGTSVIEIIARRLVSEKYDLIFALPEGEEGEFIYDEIELFEKQTPKLKVIFGSLSNVLERFVVAAENYSHESIIIRLTADNLIPNNLFVEELIDKYESGYGYAEINNNIYGASAEIFKKKHLVAAFRNQSSNYQREHVTPFIKEQFNIQSIKHDFSCKYDLRLTLDTFQDYLNLKNLFSLFDDPVTADWKDLIRKAYEIFPPQKNLVIGTAQFGMNYGVNNNTGHTKKEDVSRIIDLANKNSIFTYDTAADYGNSEEVLGENFNSLSNSRIITKLRADVNSKTEVRDSILNSSRNLKRSKLDGVLLHQYRQLDTDVWSYLDEFKQLGLVSKIGVSVYSPEEAISALSKESLDILQIPFNILDWRWSEVLQYPSNIEIHARSVFLQGAILNDEILHKKGFGWIGSVLDDIVKKFNRKNRLDLCIAYVKSQSNINYILLGFDTFEQSQLSFKYFDAPNLDKEQIDEIQERIGRIPETLLDIRTW